MTDLAYRVRPLDQGSRPNLAGAFQALRYGLVWVVWLGLFMVKPRLALECFRYRRMDSPIGPPRL